MLMITLQMTMTRTMGSQQMVVSFLFVWNNCSKRFRREAAADFRLVGGRQGFIRTTRIAQILKSFSAVAAGPRFWFGEASMAQASRGERKKNPAPYH